MKKKQEEALKILEQLINDGKLLVWVGDDGKGCSKEATILRAYAGGEGTVCIDLHVPLAED